jgi:hypothetical protein
MSLNEFDQSTQGCRRVLAYVIAFVNVLMLALAIGLTSMRLTLLNQSYLEKLPERRDLYTRLPEMLLDDFIEAARTTTGAPQIVDKIVQTVGRDQLESFVSTLIPPAWIQAQWEYNVDALFQWLHGDSDLPQLRLDTAQLRQNAQSPAMRQAVVGLLANLPECGFEDYFGFLFNEIPQCRPDDFILNPLIDDTILPGLAAIFSSRDPLAVAFAPENVDEGMQSELNFIHSSYTFLAWATWLAWISALLGIALTLLLQARSPTAFAAWPGWQFLVAAGIAFVSYGLLYLLLPSIAQWFLAALIGGGASASDIGPSLTRLLFSIMLRGMTGYALLGAVVIGFLGAVGVAASFLLGAIRR